MNILGPEARGNEVVSPVSLAIWSSFKILIPMANRQSTGTGNVDVTKPSIIDDAKEHTLAEMDGHTGVTDSEDEED